MATYTGTANSYADIVSAVQSACVAEGWALNSGILSLADAYVRLYPSDTLTSAQGPGVILQGGTGRNEATLIEPSLCQPRAGQPYSGVNGGEAPAFPVEYFIFVHVDPAEVYVIYRFNVDRHYWLAFGVSDVPEVVEDGVGTGLWIAGTARRGLGISTGGFTISPNGGSAGAPTGSWGFGSGFFWSYGDGNAWADNALEANALHCAVGAGGWQGRSRRTAEGALHAIGAAVPHIARQPNVWNGESALLPVHVHLYRAQSKCSLVIQPRNARYVRVDNYESGDIIDLAGEQWMVFPFYLKNASVRNGGNSISHTGTFGWALRHEAV